MTNLYHLPDQEFLLFTSQGLTSKRAKGNAEENRESLLRFYQYLLDLHPEKIEGNAQLRSIFSQIFSHNASTLPKIIEKDGFLALFALGKAISIGEAKKVALFFEKNLLADSSPIFFDFTPESAEFFDVDATPPGFLPKMFPHFRLKADAKLLERVREDLKKAADLPDGKRKLVTLMLLSFSLAYRECRGLMIDLPHFLHKGQLVRYHCHQHLIGEGIKTISMSCNENHPPIYLCQGTELWPSQPSMLGSILNNFAEHGSSTQAYAHSWRRIHKQLRDLTTSDHQPIVIGHSMGGALAIQIALYSHDLIESSFAFNPPMPGERDAQFFSSLSSDVQKKMQIFANLDDVAFWRIGECVFGNVTCFISTKRWRYYPIVLRDVFLFFPAIFKLIWNIKKAFPAHQKIIPLTPVYLSFCLSKEEIQEENSSRKSRFDTLHFLPKLYDPLKWLTYFIRKIFKWSLEEEYIRNEIEIIALHERDLLDTITKENSEDVKKKIEKLHQQKHILQKKIKIRN